MAEHSHDGHGTDGEAPSGGSRAGRWIFLGVALIAGYFLLTEHRAHAIQYLPFVLILACPLLHLFHGHGGHGGHDEKGKKGSRT
jgi:hypothetical protein